MRQAGRYMPEYRALRARHSLLDLCRSPELAAEVTLQPLKRISLDAAIIFSDLLLPLEPMGLSFHFAGGEGPVVSSPLRGEADIDRLRPVEPREAFRPVLEAIRSVRRELSVPLIGFVGAPFTLASYAIEGGHSSTYVHAKTLMYECPGGWHRLCDKLATLAADYLRAQIEAGVQAVQVFDSWVGALSPADYREFELPHVRAIFDALGDLQVPKIHFGTGTATLLELQRDAGGDVIGVDWRIPLDEAWDRIGGCAIQGNLEPALLLAPRDRLLAGAEDVLRRAGGRPGHIFNLGHGILPSTPLEQVQALADYVHEKTAKSVDGPIVEGSGIRDQGNRMTRRRTAILLMAHGTPDRIDQMPEYLVRVRDGRPASPQLVDEVRASYAAIGGRSPLTDITQRQAVALRAMLGADVPVLVGMRNWHPYIADVLAHLFRDQGSGIERVIGIPLAPQFSTLSVQKYVDAALAAIPSGVRFDCVRSFHDHPLLAEAFAERVRDASPAVGEEVIFTAHAVPIRVVEAGDPYADQVAATAAAVAARAGVVTYRLAWQSAGRTPEPWLGPDIAHVLRDRAAVGGRRFLIVPIGFVCDHTEVLFDLDIKAARVARQGGAQLRRTASLNDSPSFIRLLAALVDEKMAVEV